MTIRRLPPEQAGGYQGREIRAGVFRRPTALHTVRLPSRADVYHDDGAAAPEKGKRGDLDPRPVSPPLSPRAEQIGLAPPAGGQ